MSARIQAEFLRLDRALRGGCNLRSSLKADSLQAWEDCLESLVAVKRFLVDGSCIFTSASDKSAAVWLQWRKSNTSKQLLGLVRSVLEPAAAAQANRREVAAPVRAWMSSGLHASIDIASFLHAAAAMGVLWPALREWLMEQGGVDTMWRALAWGLADALKVNNSTQAIMILISVDNILPLSLHCPKPPLRPNDALLKGHGSEGVTVLQLTLGTLLPAAFPAMQPDSRTRAVALAHRIGLLCCSSTPAAEKAGEEYLEPMHLPALQAWPYLIGAARHQISAVVQDSKEREGLQVRAHSVCMHVGFMVCVLGARRIAHGMLCLAHCAWRLDHNLPCASPCRHRRLLWGRCSL